MTEVSIDKLRTQNFSRKPREQFGYIGESAAIRMAYPKDKVDMQRLRTIQATLPESFEGADLNDMELIEEAELARPGFNRAKDSEFTFIVSGSEDVPEGEKGEMQGWVNFYRDDYIKPLQQLDKLPGDLGPNKLVLNVSIAKHPDASSHQMASGLRQACMYLAKINAGRQGEMRQKRTTTKPDFIVTAYASNIESENTLNAAGFDNKGKISLFYEPENKNYDYVLYELDWNLLNQIMQEKALPGELFSREPAPKPSK